MGLPEVKRADDIVQGSWDSGMITILPPEELPPDAAVLIQNFEFDSKGNLVTRAGAFTSFNIGDDEHITSLFRAKYSDGTVFIIGTTPTRIFKVDQDGTNFTNITGLFVLPTDARRWHWVMFNDFAIGTAQGQGTPLKVSNAGTVSFLNNAPASARAIEVWNNRLWLAENGENTVYGSSINDPEDWTIDDDAGAITLGVDIGDGDRILALKQFKGSLYVYKRTKIHVISAISAPATIPSNLRVDIYTDDIGLAASDSIQTLLDDQIFLSDLGVMSLALAPLGETRTSILSRNIDELSGLQITDVVNTAPIESELITSLNIPGLQQYLLSIPASFSPTGSDIVYVMDYSDIMQRDEEGFPKVRWCVFDGTITGSAYVERIVSGVKSYFVAKRFVTSTNTPVFTYSPLVAARTFDTTATTKRFLSRAFGLSTIRSLWHRFAVSLTKLTTNVTFITNYYFDNYTTSVAGTYTHTLTGTPSNSNRTIWKSFKKNDSGRKANLVQIEITANTVSQGFTIKSLHMENTKLNFRRATTKWNSD